MIVQIEGRLLRLSTDRAVMQVGQLAYEIMLPGYVVSSLAGKIGSDITLCTLEYYEGTPAGGNLIPRMVGFMSEGEKDFFLKYTTVKGIGIKKALRSLNIPISAIASAIEDGNEKTLLALPEIGKRLAQQIIAELKGKLISFAMDAGKTTAAAKSMTPFQIEALEILIAWGEKRNEAMELIELACKKHPNIKTAEELVPLIYRIKQGAEA
ncbi:MAG: Holliday junction branch migration protein RuvA [Sedimentisphaerales bacterium]|nr:Holliday junction branch migration protein RuvA [Sedimentisphaerales bacterium]